MRDTCLDQLGPVARAAELTRQQHRDDDRDAAVSALLKLVNEHRIAIALCKAIGVDHRPLEFAEAAINVAIERVRKALP